MRSSSVIARISSQPPGQRVNSFRIRTRVRDSGVEKEGRAVWRFLKRLFKLGLLVGVAYGVWRWFESQRSESDVRWEAQPAPFPPAPRPAETVHVPSQVVPPGGPETEPADVGAAWVEPTGSTCPPSHPVKAKMSSKIFHVAGGLNYERTHPDRCYRDAAAAESDGLRKAAR